MLKFIDIIKLLRPAQWVKNLFVLMPALFGGVLLESDIALRGFEGVILFCLMSSVVYIINDIADRRRDHRHPVKRNRPIASGRVSVSLAAAVAAVILSVCVTLSQIWFLYNGEVDIILLGYLLLNICYSLWLKNIAIVDTFVVAFGFVLRVLLGGVICDVTVSPWLVMMVFLLCLLLAFGKRRDDLIKAKQGENIRRSVTGYNITFINQVLSMLGASTIVAYICYTMQADVIDRFGTQYVYLTSVFVIAGIVRYLQIAMVKEDSGKPSSLIYGDRFIRVCVLLWIVTFMIIIYAPSL